MHTTCLSNFFKNKPAIDVGVVQKFLVINLKNDLAFLGLVQYLLVKVMKLFPDSQVVKSPAGI